MTNIIDSTINKYAAKKSGHKKLHQVIVKDYFNNENKSYNKYDKNKIREEILKRSNEIYKKINDLNTSEVNYYDQMIEKSNLSTIQHEEFEDLEYIIGKDLDLNQTIALLGNEVFAKQMLYYLCYGKLITEGLADNSEKNLINSNAAFKVMCDALPKAIREHFLAAIYHRNSYNKIDWIPFKKSHHLTKTAEVFIKQYLLPIHGNKLIDDFCHDLISKPKYYKGNRRVTIAKLNSFKVNQQKENYNVKTNVTNANKYMTNYVNMGIHLLKQNNFAKQINDITIKIQENKNIIQLLQEQSKIIKDKMTNISITSNIVNYLITKNFDKDFTILKNIQFNDFLTTITNKFLENKSQDYLNSYKDLLLQLHNKIDSEIEKIEGSNNNLTEALNLYSELNKFYARQTNHINLVIQNNKNELKQMLDIKDFSEFVADTITNLTTASSCEKMIDSFKNSTKILLASISAITTGVVTYLTSRLFTDKKWISAIAVSVASVATYKGTKSVLANKYSTPSKNNKLTNFELAIKAKSNLEDYKSLLLDFENLLEYYREEVKSESLKNLELQKEYAQILNNDKFKGLVDKFLFDYNNYYINENIGHKKEKELIKLILVKYSNDSNDSNYFIDNLFIIIDRYINNQHDFNTLENDNNYLLIRDIATLLNKTNIPSRAFQHELLFHTLKSSEIDLSEYKKILLVTKILELYIIYVNNKSCSLNYKLNGIIRMENLEKCSKTFRQIDNHEYKEIVKNLFQYRKESNQLESIVNDFINELSAFNAQGTVFEKLINIRNYDDINKRHEDIKIKIKDFNIKVSNFNVKIKAENKKQEWLNLDLKLSNLVEECNKLLELYDYNDDVVNEENKELFQLNQSYDRYKSQPFEPNIKRFEVLCNIAESLIKNYNDYKVSIVSNYFDKLSDKFDGIDLIENIKNNSQDIIFANKLYKSIAIQNKMINLFDIKYLDHNILMKRKYTKTISNMSISKNLYLKQILPIINEIHDLNNLNDILNYEFMNIIPEKNKQKIKNILDFINILQDDNSQMLYDNKVSLTSILYNSTNNQASNNETSNNKNIYESKFDGDNNGAKKILYLSPPNNGIFSLKTLCIVGFSQDLDSDEKVIELDEVDNNISEVNYDTSLNSSIISINNRHNSVVDPIHVSKFSNEEINNKLNQYENLLKFVFNPDYLNIPGYTSLILRLVEVYFRVDNPQYANSSSKVQIYFKWIESEYSRSFDTNMTTGILNYLDLLFIKYNNTLLSKNQLFINILSYTINKINMLTNQFIVEKIISPITNSITDVKSPDYQLANYIVSYYNTDIHQNKLSLKLKLDDYSQYRHLKLYKCLENYCNYASSYDSIVNLANLIELLKTPNNYLDVSLLLFVSILEFELIKVIKLNEHYARGGINHASMVGKSFHRAINDLPQYIKQFLANIDLIKSNPHLFDAINFALNHLFVDDNLLVVSNKSLFNNYFNRDVACQVLTPLDLNRLNSISTPDSNFNRINTIKARISNVKVNDEQNKILLLNSVYNNLVSCRELLTKINLQFNTVSIINSVNEDMENISEFDKLIEKIKEYLNYSFCGDNFDILQTKNYTKPNNSFDELVYNLSLLLMLYKKIRSNSQEDEEIVKRLILSVINTIPANKFLENDYSLKYIYKQAFLNLKDNDLITYDKIFDNAIFFDKSLLLNSDDKLKTFEFIISLVAIEIKKDSFLIPDNYSNTNLEFFKEHLNEFFRQSRNSSSSKKKDISNSLQKLAISTKLSDELTLSNLIY